MKLFLWSQNDCFKQLDRRVYEYVTEKQNRGMSVTRAVIQLTTSEVVKQVNPLVNTDFI